MKKVILILFTALVLVVMISPSFGAGGTGPKPKKADVQIQNKKNTISYEIVDILENLIRPSAALASTESEEGKEGKHEEGGLPIEFPGWQVPFAVIASIYYALALKILPSLIEKKGESGGHH